MRDEFRIAIDNIPGLVWSALPDGYVDFLNQRWCEYTGLSMENALGWGWQAAVCPDDLPSLLAIWRNVLDSGAPGELVARLRRFDGELRWFLFRALPLHDEAGHLVKWYGQTTDIDDQKRAEALLAGEKRLLEMIATGHSLPQVLDAMCLMVEETAGSCLCGIMLLDPSGTRLEQSVAPSLPASYHAAIRDKPVNPDATPCSAAVHLKEQVVVADAASDPRWGAHGWRALAAAHGLRACWSTPILSTDGTALGTFALYGRKPGAPTPQLQNVIGQMTHVAAVAIERARTAAALQESEERFRRMADAIPEVIWIRDLEPAHVLYASPSFEWIWGVPLDALYANPRLWTDPVHPEDRAAVMNAFARWTGGDDRGGYDIEFRIVQPSGVTRWIHERGVLIVNERGKPYRASGISTDITERRHAEEERRRHDAILAEAERLSVTGSFGWRVLTGELIWSKETHRIYELALDVTPTFEFVRERIHPDDLLLFNQTASAAAAQGKDFAFEHRLQMSDGSIKYLQVLGHALRDDQGQLVEYVGAVKDVTDRKSSEDALHQVRSELAHVTRVTTLGELTASIAHELNQPLLGIVTNATTCLRLLAEHPPNLDGARDTARRTIRDGDRAAAVIARLRALFKKKGAGTETFDLNEAIQEVLVLLRSELTKSRIALRTELGTEVPLIAGDRVQLQQVMLNLILNACEAMSSIMDRPRQLVITTQPDVGEGVQVTVRDSGAGLDPNTRELIFQPFYTSKSDGMGMGLSISRSIVESHRGRLRGESNDGHGATFVFTVPRAPIAVSGEQNRRTSSVDI